MLRITLAAASALLLIGVSAVSAQTTTSTTTTTVTTTDTCAAQIDRANKILPAMTDQVRQGNAVAEVTTASRLLGEKDEIGCQEHMQNAMTIMR
jgi:hypothetical protein